MRPAIEVKSISKVFESMAAPIRALDDVSLSIQQNEFFTLLGPSGCGKTTLLRLIAGFEFPSAGTLLLDGEDVIGLPPYKRQVNTVFQSYALFPHMSVSENVSFGLEMRKWPKSRIAERVTEMLRLVKMEALKDRPVTKISGGQQQRVALARALAPQPKVLLLDEPLSALDFKLRKEMQIELKRLQHETGITFIFVTHDQEEALTMSDRIAVMSMGRICQIGTPREIYDRPTMRFVADFIGDTNFLEGRIERIVANKAEVRLSTGAVVSATLPGEDSPTKKIQDKVTIVIRPEHAQLVPNGGDAILQGVLENVVYFGTDTNYYARLREGGTFIIRSQNRCVEKEDMTPGTAVGISVEEDAAQILRD